MECLLHLKTVLRKSVERRARLERHHYTICKPQKVIQKARYLSLRINVKMWKILIVICFQLLSLSMKSNRLLVDARPFVCPGTGADVGVAINAEPTPEDVTSLVCSVSLTGKIPTSIGAYVNVSILGLGANSLTGSLPTEIGLLTKLTHLNMDNSGITGPIPTQVGNLVRLTAPAGLLLSNNKLNGSLPTQLAQVTGLVNFFAQNNMISSSIPSEYGNLADLQGLQLEFNSLNGPIPTELAKLQALKLLRLSENELSSSIPIQISMLNGLEFLHLQRNDLTGTLPTGRLLGIVQRLLTLYFTCYF